MRNQTVGNKVTLDHRFINEIEAYKNLHKLTWEKMSAGITTNSRYLISIVGKISKEGQATANKDLIEEFCKRIGKSLETITVDNLRPYSNAIKGNFSDPDKFQKLHFIGADTLTITTLAKAFCDLGYSQDVSVVVKGRDNQHNIDNVEIIGCITGAKLEGYQRTVYMCGKNHYGEMEENIDIGGDNASVERIASTSFLMHIPKEILSEVAGKTIVNGSSMPFGLGVDILKTNELEKMVKFFMENHAITHAVDIAKQIRTPVAAKYLMGALEKNYSPEINAQVTDSFRVFSETCQRNHKLAQELTKKLIDYVIGHQNDDNYSLAIIYAAEALGYISRFSPNSRKMAFECLYNNSTKFGMSENFRDLVWASIISMERTFVSHVDIDSFGESINLGDDCLGIAFRRLKTVYDQSKITRRKL